MRNKKVVLFTVSLQNIIIFTESLKGLDWKEPQGSSSSNSPATGRATNLQICYKTKLLRAPSNLALNAYREGASTASLGSLFQCSVTLSEVLSHVQMKIPVFQFVPTVPCPVTEHNQIDPGPILLTIALFCTFDIS